MFVLTANNFATRLHSFLPTLGVLKLFTIILSIYVTCLTLVPCSDFENTHSDEELSIEATHEHDHSGDCDDDTCTPFCMCACCHTNVVVNEEVLESTFELVTYEALFHDFYTDMVTTPYYDMPFHPPIG